MISWHWTVWRASSGPEWGPTFEAVPMHWRGRAWLSLWCGPLCVTLPWWRRRRT